MASFVAGDTGSKFEFTCKNDSDGSAINLTGSTVKLRWQDSAGTLVERTMTITDAPNGVAEYQFAAGELFSPSMDFDVEITDSSGNVVTSLELMTERVRAAF